MPDPSSPNPPSQPASQEPAAQGSKNAMQLQMHAPNISCPPFRAEELRRQMSFDSLCRWGLFLLFVFSMTLITPGESEEGPGSPAFALAIGISLIWIAMGSVSTSVARQIPLISQWIETAPAQAESLLATSLKRKPLQRAIRILLYQRLAALRFKQGDYAQAAAICDELLRQPVASKSSQLMQKIPGVGRTGSLRPALLLMLTESHLIRRDFYNAYQCLVQLHQIPLEMGESLHRNALQTRYEVASGLFANAVSNLREKVHLAELMPGPQSGTMHAMLALAASRIGNQDAANWLFARAELLCPPGQLVQLRAEGLA